MKPRNLSWLATALLACSSLVLAAEPFNIDVVLPLTGPAAFLGKAEQVALQRAETPTAELQRKLLVGIPMRLYWPEEAR